ncbi:MAG TPA: methyltransferase [Nevskiaceae bacterium]|nr:methyltransferase [Nevskiaceae bacterium]
MDERGITLRYDVDRTRLPLELRSVFVELDADASTRAWIDDALTRRRPYARMALRGAAMAFVNLYDANGWLSICQDRLLGTEQWRRLLGKGGASLLDVGAGDGTITQALAALFDQVVTTELSAPMARRLRARGYACHQIDLAFDTIDGRFDVVALQNVIDRTTHPLRLLDGAAALLADGGRVVVAVPVPIEPGVFKGSAILEPAEVIPAGIGNFEEAVTALWTQVFEPRGYRVTALTRAPYLCNGSVRSRVEVLDDAIFVLAAD